MKILIDLYPCYMGSKLRGIGRYAYNFVKYLVQEADESIEIFLIGNIRIPETSKLLMEFNKWLPTKNIIPYFLPTKNETIECDEKINLLFQHILYKTNVDLIISLSPFDGYLEPFANYNFSQNEKNISRAAIIYDFIPLIFEKEYLSDLNYRNFYFKQLSALKQFDFYFSISGSTTTDAIKYLNLKKEDIKTVWAGNSELFYDSSFSAIRPNLSLNKDRFILFAGNIDFRKNLPKFLDAYGSLPQSLKDQYPVCLTYVDCSKETMKSLMSANNIKPNNYFFLGRVDDLELKWLYEHCYLLCMPSLYEGFGLPIVEAMSVNTVTLSGNNSSLKEISAHHELLFDATSKESISNSLFKFISDNNYKNSFRAICKKHSKKFTWEQTAKDTFDFINHKKAEIFKNKKQNPPIVLPKEISMTDFDKRNWIYNDVFLTTRRLIIDTTELSTRNAKTGIQRVVRKVIDDLERLHPIVLTIGCKDNKFFNTDKDDNEFFTFLESEFRFEPGDVLFKLDSSWEAHPTFLNFQELLNELNVHIIEMVYDLIPITHPECCNPIIIPVYTTWLNHAILNSNTLICISKNTADNLITYANEQGIESNAKIYYNHLGSDFKKQTNISQTSQNVKNNTCHFLMVGTIEPRKNYDLVIKTFRELRKKNKSIKLTIVGKLGWNMNQFEDSISDLINQEYFNWYKNLDDRGLEQLYLDCDALIQASLEEGFGLPIIEALHRNLPVIANNLAVFREIVGEKIYYFENNLSSIYRVMDNFQKLSKEKRIIKHQSYESLSWQKSNANLLSKINGDSKPYFIFH